MSAIVTRAGKGSALTHAEADANFTNLNTDKVEEDDVRTLTNKTIVVASNTITTAASGNLAATELNAALAELDTDKVPESDFSAFGKTLVDDADASAALTTLGVSTYAKTILDDATAKAAKDTLQIQVDGLTELRGLTPVDGEILYLKYHTTQGDGGHGVFEALTGAAALTYTDDNGVTIVPTGGDGSSCWRRRLNGFVTPEMFGAVHDGLTDDLATIQAAIDAMYAFGGGDVILQKGWQYAISDTLVIKEGVVLKSTAPLFSQVKTTSGRTLTELAQIICLAGSFDGIRFTDTSYSAGVKGIYLIGTALSVSGNGIVMGVTGGNRTKRVVENMVVQGFPETGILQIGSKEDYVRNVYSLENGAFGLWAKDVTADCFYEFVNTAYNGLSGFYWGEGCGAGRITSSDSWDNTEHGYLFEGQNITGYRLQADINRLSGFRIKKGTGGATVKRIQLIAPQTLRNGLGVDGLGLQGHDVHISDGANDILIVDGTFGYGFHSTPAIHAIYDDSATPANNTIFACSFEYGAYREALSGSVLRYYNLQGINRDSSPYPITNSNTLNHVINSDFRDWVSASLPSGWTNTAVPTLSQLTNQGERGYYAAQLVSDATVTDQFIQQDIQYPPESFLEKTLTLSADIEVTGLASAWLEVRVGSSPYLLEIPETVGYKRFMVRAPVGATAGEVRVRVYAKRGSISGANTSTVKVSNITLTTGPSPSLVTKDYDDKFSSVSVLAASATPDAPGYNVWEVQGATAITNITSYYEGRRIIVIGNGSVQLTHGTSLFLKGGVSRTPYSGEAVELLRIKGAWREL